MRKVLSVLVGFVILAAAAVLLWMAYGPTPKEKRVTGGILYTQAEIAQQGVETMDATTDDVYPINANAVGEVAIGASALADMSTLDAEEAVAPVMVREPLSADAPALTTNVTLTNETDVAVAPLQVYAVGTTPAPDGVGGAAVTEQRYEQRVVEMEWPSQFRVGGSGSVRIKFKMLSDGSLQPVAEIATNQVIATPILISDQYDTHIATVTANISAPDFEITAVNNATQTLTRGGEAEWRWTLKADEAKTAIIAIGITITWTPKPDAPVAYAASTNAIWGQTVQVDINHVFGLITVPQASIAGTVLAVVGFIAEIPLIGKILEALWEAIFNRKKKESSSYRG